MKMQKGGKMKLPEYPNDKVSLGVYKIGAWTGILFLIYSVATIMIFALVGEGYPG